MDGGKPLDRGINREKVKDGWRDEQREGVEQTGTERRWRQESNLVKSEWDVLFLNVERGGHSLGEKREWRQRDRERCRASE